MTGDRWTILLYKGGDTPGRQYTVHRRIVRRVTRLTALLGFVLTGVFGWLIWEGDARLETLALRAENQALLDRLETLGAEVESLEHAVTAVTQKDAELRALAAMNTMDDGGLRAGLVNVGSGAAAGTWSWDADSIIARTAFNVLFDVESLQARTRLIAASIDAKADSVRSSREIFERTPSILPTRGRLTSRFSAARLHPMYDRVMPHEGLDISAPRGTPVVATAKGRVVRAGTVAGYGMLVEIDHGHGYLTRYAHASRLLVRMGQTVERGDRIAEVGRSGRATSTHLHYEVLLRGVPQNPERFLFTQIAP